MATRDSGDHRYRGWLRFDGNDCYKGFVIEQVDPPNQMGGEGPYRVMFRGKEIYRANYHGDCKYHILDIVEDYIAATKSFSTKWNLSRFPDRKEI